MRPQAVMIKVPLLLPGEFAITEIEPARSLYRMLDEIDMVPGILDSSLLIGYAWADSPHASVSVIVVAEQDRTPALRHAARLATAVWKRRADFQPESELLGIDQAIALARSIPEHPVFLSDAGDNVTAGGAGDIPLFIERLLAAEVSDAVVAGICDPDAVAQCVAAGVGGTVTAALGGKLDPVHGSPLLVTGMVTYLDPAEHPSSAVLRIGGVEIILTTDRRPIHQPGCLSRGGDRSAYTQDGGGKTGLLVSGVAGQLSTSLVGGESRFLGPPPGHLPLPPAAPSYLSPRCRWGVGTE